MAYQRSGSVDGLGAFFDKATFFSMQHHGRDAWEEIAAGDGEAIAKLGCMGGGCSALKALPILLSTTRIERGRQALAGAFRFGRYNRWSGSFLVRLDWSPPKLRSQMAHAAYLGDIAAALGDADLARQWRAVARRYRAAWLWRPLAVPMFLIGEDQ